MTELEETDVNLSQKIIKEIVIDSLIPEVTINLSLEDSNDFSKAMTVNTKRSTATILKEHIQKSIQDLEHDSGDLSNNEKYSDNYYYKLSVYYKLIGEFVKEKEYLKKIKDKKNTFYREAIVKNNIALQSDLNGTMLELLSLDTVESIRSLSAVMISQGKYTEANKELERFLQSQNSSDSESYDLLCQYGFTFMIANNITKAIHVFRYVFFNIRNSWEIAITLSCLYKHESKKFKKLLDKSVYWAKMALILNPSSYEAAVYFYRLQSESELNFYTRFMENFVTLPSIKSNKQIYIDSVNNLANCYFIQKKYSKAFETIQSICDSEYFSAGIWCNIALCNSMMKKPERALKNITKSYSKLTTEDSDLLHRAIIGVYLKILYEQKMYKQVIMIFEQYLELNFVPLSKDEFLKICEHYLRALLYTKNYERYSDYLALLYNTTEESIKVCVVNLLIKYHSDYNYNAVELKKYSKDLQNEFLKFRKTSKGIPYYFNNIVYSIIEANEQPSPDLMKLFVQNIHKNSFLCATYGLYQARIKMNLQKCEFYYNKAIQIATTEDLPMHSCLLTELHFKRDLELLRLNKKLGNNQDASRFYTHIQKKCPTELWYYAQCAASLIKN